MAGSGEGQRQKRSPGQAGSRGCSARKAVLSRAADWWPDQRQTATRFGRLWVASSRQMGPRAGLSDGGRRSPQPVAAGAAADLEIVAPSVRERNSEVPDVVLPLLPRSAATRAPGWTRPAGYERQCGSGREVRADGASSTRLTNLAPRPRGPRIGDPGAGNTHVCRWTGDPEDLRILGPLTTVADPDASGAVGSVEIITSSSPITTTPTHAPLRRPARLADGARRRRDRGGHDPRPGAGPADATGRRGLVDLALAYHLAGDLGAEVSATEVRHVDASPIAGGLVDLRPRAPRTDRVQLPPSPLTSTTGDGPSL
jgi:hypothetical protein